MKVLQIIQRSQLRGAEIFACQLSEELKRKGVVSDIAYLFVDSDFKLDFDLRFISIGGTRGRRFWDFKAYKQINAIIEEGQYDLVQANAGDTLKYAAISKMLYRWKTPLVFRNANKMGSFIKNWRHLLLNRFFLSFCESFISVSENCRQDLIKLYPEAAQKSTTATIGTYLFESTTAISVDKSDKEVILISVGSLVAEKNHALVIDIFHSFYTRHQRGYLWIVGDGKLRNELEAKVSALALGDRVKFWGFKKDVIAILKAADVMVMPSLIEGLPAVILEALACKVSVIASNVGGIPEVIKDQDTGLCISSFDKEDYLTALEKVLFQDDFRQRITRNGFELVKNSFLMVRIADQFMGIYKKMIKQ